MLVAFMHGRYRFAPKKIAYRSDFCLTCGQPRLAEKFRTFDAYHLCFIPVIPLGFWKHWHCTACGRDPHHRVATSPAIKVLAAFLLVVIIAAVWLLPYTTTNASAKADDMAGIWIMRIAAPVGLYFLIKDMRNREVVTTLRDGLAEIDPLSAETCLYCQGALDSAAHCSRCSLTREIANAR